VAELGIDLTQIESWKTSATDDKIFLGMRSGDQIIISGTAEVEAIIYHLRNYLIEEDVYVIDDI
jgi:hypothetical protein